MSKSLDNQKSFIKNHWITFIGIGIAIFFILLAMYYSTLQPRQIVSEFTINLLGEEPCMIELCRNEFCFGLEVTDCEVMREKCEDSSYLEQWNIECTTFS